MNPPLNRTTIPRVWKKHSTLALFKLAKPVPLPESEDVE